VELTPLGKFDATLHLAERNGWGDTKLEARSRYERVP